MAGAVGLDSRQLGKCRLNGLAAVGRSLASVYRGLATADGETCPAGGFRFDSPGVQCLRRYHQGGGSPTLQGPCRFDVLLLG